MASEQLSLSCTAQFYSGGIKENDRKANLWKTCTWTRNSDGAVCKIKAEDDFSTDFEYCDKTLGEVNNLGGNRGECKINILKARIEDLGNWSCKIEKCRDERNGGCEHRLAGDCIGEDTVMVQVN